VRNALLLAEPEDATRGFLGRHLTDDGFDVVETAYDLDALTLAERARPDLVLLSELDLCRRLREGEPGRSWDRDVPVIVLAPPEADPVDRVRAFARGADDVVERPFHYEELLARIRAVLRRTGPPARELLEAGDLVVDRRTRRVSVRGEQVELAGREFELVARLAEDPHRVLTKEQLLREVWGYRSLGSKYSSHPNLISVARNHDDGRNERRRTHAAKRFCTPPQVVPAAWLRRLILRHLRQECGAGP
jgi:DNA-binding response OmpR family regulator